MNHEFEKYAREQFRQEEIEVDTEALWADVYSHVKKDKDKRRFLWFFLFGLFVGLSLFGFYHYSQQPNTDTLNSMGMVSAISDERHQGEESATTSLSIINTNESEQSTSQSTTAAEQTYTPAVTEKPITNTVTTASQSTESESESNNPPIYNNTSTPFVLKSKSVEPKIKSTTTTPTLPISDNTSSQKTSSEETPKKKDLIKDVNKQTAEIKKTSTQLLMLEVLEGTVVDNGLDATPKVVAKLEEELKAREKAKEANASQALRDIRFGIGLYGGISRTSTNLEASNQSFQNYTRSRNETEEQLETLHAGLSLDLIYDNKYYLRSGVEYTRIASLLQLDSQFVIKDSIIGPKKIIINKVTNDTLIETGLIAIDTIIDYKKRTYNYTHLIDIPVLVGFQVGNEPWSIGLEAGVFLNISARYQGDILDQDSGAIYSLQDDTKDWYKKNIGITPFIGVNASYAISENMMIHVSPGFRFNNLFSTDKHVMKQRHSSLGLRVGVRYLFD